MIALSRDQSAMDLRLAWSQTNYCQLNIIHCCAPSFHQCSGNFVRLKLLTNVRTNLISYPMLFTHLIPRYSVRNSPVNASYCLQSLLLWKDPLLFASISLVYTGLHWRENNRTNEQEKNKQKNVQQKPIKKRTNTMVVWHIEKRKKNITNPTWTELIRVDWLCFNIELYDGISGLVGRNGSPTKLWTVR